MTKLERLETTFLAAPCRERRNYEFGPFLLDCGESVLFRGHETVPLAPKAVDTLIVLVENAGNLVSKDELIRAVWPDTFVEESNLTQNIFLLRKALAAGSENGESYIETIPKRGYRFTAQVKPPPPRQPQIAVIGSSTAPVRRRPRGWLLWPLLASAAIVALALGTYVWHARTGSVSGIRSIAVLPVLNLSGDPAQEFLADGITDALTAELAKVRTLSVISRTSAMHFKGSNRRLQEIAGELHADAIVEGSLVTSGGRLQIRMQLIHAASDRHLWAENYERDFRDILALQSEIASTIAHEIRIQLSPQLTRARHTVPPSALEPYLRGRYLMNKRTEESVRQAIVEFNRSEENDPLFAPAYAALADCYNQLGTAIIGTANPSKTRPLAIAAARKALELDDQLAEAHAALAYASLYDWEWARAEQSFRRAIRLNPSYAPAHQWYASYFAAQGNFQEARAEIDLARQLDPLSPIVETQSGWMLSFARRNDEAIAVFQGVLSRQPDYLWALWQLGLAYEQKGMYAKAIEVLERAAVIAGRSPAILGSLGRAYALAGDRPKAESLLSELTRVSSHRYVTPVAFVSIHLGLGNREECFAWLERAYAERSNGLLYLQVWQMVDPLRADPRFQNLQRRIGFPRHWQPPGTAKVLLNMH